MVNLHPADMPAVLERTKLKVNEENCLLPIYEAVSNAIYSAQMKWGADVAEKGKVQVDIRTTNFEAHISDNGAGLDDINFGHFLTPFTGFRLKKGGKGFGRFIAFKVFDDIAYASRYDGATGRENRAFTFDINKEPQIDGSISSPPQVNFETGCVVRYRAPKEEFEKAIESLEGEEIVERTIRYFLPFFLSDEMPDLKILVDGASFDTRSHFSEFFTPEIDKTIDIDLGSETREFKIDISRVKRERLFKEHMTLLFADGRIIGSGRKIAGKIGNQFFESPEGDKQIYIASVRGEFLDDRANTARTEIEATKEEIDAIVDQVAKFILEKEKEFVERHRTSQSKSVANALIRNPLLRSALRGKPISEYVANKPMSWKAEEFVSDLALQRLRDQNNWQKEFEAGLKAPEKLVEMREKITEHLDEENKDALASYVAHRKSVIELTDAILGYQADGRMSPEDMLHDLVHPRYEDSETTKFYQHNLWLLDERLAFFTYCSSDRTNHGGRRQQGDKVADLVLFEDCSIFREGDQGAVVLIEFKKPGRNDYKFGVAKADPIQQVIDTAVKIRDEGRIISKSGRTIAVEKGTRVYAYLVADMEPTLRSICENHDMHDTWDNSGYYLYHSRKDMFVEVISYSKMLEDAKKRNAAFIEILLGEIIHG